jgi:hypothetical protein
MATLKVKIQEDIIVQNQDYSSKRVNEITGVNDVFKRIVSVPANNDVTLVNFQANVGSASYTNIDVDLLKYMRVTNLDSSNSINLAVVGDTMNFQVVLEAGHSYMLSKADDGMVVEGATDTSPAFSGFEEINKLVVKGSDALNVEFFLASA